MIAFLSGQVLTKNQKSIILVTNQQVGYEVFLATKDLEECTVNTAADFYIHTHIRTDILELYGFKTKEHIDFFKKLISVSGVGPKSALNIIGLASLLELKKAITSGDPTILQQVSGIGKKTAERLVVELKEKILIDLSSQIETIPANDQVIEALISLGYKERDAREVVKNISPDGDLGERVKNALNIINQRNNAR